MVTDFDNSQAVFAVIFAVNSITVALPAKAVTSSSFVEAVAFTAILSVKSAATSTFAFSPFTILATVPVPAFSTTTAAVAAVASIT